MTEIEIVVRPHSLGRRGTRYSAFVHGKELCRARTPLFAAARVLRAQGYPDDAILVMRHEGSSVVSLRATLGRAAELTVLEGDRRGPELAKFSVPHLRTPGCSSELELEDTDPDPAA